ncbi:MAG: hypothetical protein WCC90_00440 [Methylocella sp.]
MNSAVAAAQERREFAALGLAEFDAVAYIHLCLLAVRGTRCYDEQASRLRAAFVAEVAALYQSEAA